LPGTATSSAVPPTLFRLKTLAVLRHRWQARTCGLLALARFAEGKRPVALTEIDRNLLNRCLAREPGAWKDFVDRFIGLFLHVINHTAHCRNVQLSQDDVDDLCAEIFLTLLENDFAVLRRFREKSSLATYLTVVARRVVVRELTKRQSQDVRERFAAQVAALQKNTPDNGNGLESREAVERVLKELPKREAEVLRQHHLEGKSYEEISRSLGMPQNSVGPTLTRAREHARRRLQQKQPEV